MLLHRPSQQEKRWTGPLEGEEESPKVGDKESGKTEPLQGRTGETEMWRYNRLSDDAESYTWGLTEKQRASVNSAPLLARSDSQGAAPR